MPNERPNINPAVTGHFVRSYAINTIKAKKTEKNEYEGKLPAPIDKDPELYKSALGTPVYSDIVFRPVTYTDQRTGKQVTTEEQRYETVLLTVHQAKRIIKTEIQGLDSGTVKEYIALDDFQVTINGIITGANGVYPGDKVKALKGMMDAPVAIPVVCKYLNDMEIYNLVVEDYSLDQKAGGYSKQDFTILTISDTPIELQIQ